MGQGFSLATPSAGAAGIDVPELSDLTYEKSLGNARFMKSVRARHRDGLVLVKVLVKPYTVELERYRKEIIRQRRALSKVPNALGFQRVIETETNGFLVRQYLYSSLYDRISTRPFLEDIEKKWLAFQLLCALRDCHSRDIYHGDIKAQNVLVTSWNWLYLSDFSSAFKPVMLPDDLPADFSYFFDTSGRRTCYIAPERFLAAGETAPADAKLTWAMDIFSAGCVMAQMFLETEIFSLAQLFSYRQGKYNPVITHLSLIADKDVRDMISHMIQLDPEKRYSAEQYLDFWKGKVFPEYFYNFLHQYMELVTDSSSGNSPISGAAKNLGEPDDRIDRVFYDFDKISYFLGHHNENRAANAIPSTIPTTITLGNEVKKYQRLALGHFPVRLNIPNHEHAISDAMEPPEDDGTLLFLALVLSSLRNTARAASKIRACDVLLAFAERLTDDAKLDRVLPYLVTMLTDDSEMVVVSAIRSITQLLQLVRVITPINAHVFTEYILPRMEAVLRNRQGAKHSLTRATYASSIGSLALTALRFLGATGSTSGSSPTESRHLRGNHDIDDVSFDNYNGSAHRQLVEMLESHTKTLVEDPDTQVRRAFLSSVPELCIFFEARSNEILLSHLNTYLNDKDWMLKCAFFDTIVGIGAFVGGANVEAFILPLMVQALSDAEEFVVQEVIHSLAQLASLGLFSKARLWELVDLVARFTMHPNVWIRGAAAELIAASAKYLDMAEIRCILVPIIHPYLKPDIIPRNFAVLELLDHLKKPLRRNVFDQAILWASKADKGMFWKNVVRSSSNNNKNKSGGLPFLSRDLFNGKGSGGSSSSSKIPRNEEDEQWLTRLGNLGLAPDEEFKLVALREFIWLSLKKTAVRNLSDIEEPSGPGMLRNHVISLKNLGITPQTVLFEPIINSGPGSLPGDPSALSRYSIEDALLDASMTIDDTLGNRKRAAINTHRARVSRGSLSPAGRQGRDSSQDSRRQSTMTARGLLSPTTPTNDHNNNDDSDGASFNEEAGGGASYSNRRSIRHQSSALNLLDRKDGNKTTAETGTTETNAFGQVEAPYSPSSLAGGGDSRATATDERMRARHTYEGNDPSILKMLNAMYIETYPYDNDFGPIVSINNAGQGGNNTGSSSAAAAAAAAASSSSSRGNNGSSSNNNANRQPWRPTGSVVATFSEHHGAINRVAVSPDSLFFVTGSDDGTVKIWDSGRLERNITHRSRQTHRHAAGARVVALCFVENTHSFVSCATDGKIQVVRVDVHTSASTPAGAPPSTAVTRYGKLRVVRDYDLPAGEHAVWAAHFKGAGATSATAGAGASTLLVATNRSRILALDLRDMTLQYTLDNPVHHGTPTCLCLDRKRHWLCVGTSHGVVDLWDLRFRRRLRAWGLAGRCPIYRIAVHPTRGRGKWICVAGGTAQGEITVWDLEKTTCRESYRVSGASSAKDPSLKAYEPWAVDQDRPEGMLGRFATTIEPSDAPAADRGVRALAVATADDGASDIRSAFLLTGGSDKKLRFWDVLRIEQSLVYSGLRPDEAQASFAAAQPTTSLTVNAERAGRPESTTGGGGAGGAAAAGAGAGSARSTVTALQQHDVLRAHLDAVLDIAVLGAPYWMSVSVDRMGVVYVFQ